jgi:hypothetical protein
VEGAWCGAATALHSCCSRFCLHLREMCCLGHTLTSAHNCLAAVLLPPLQVLPQARPFQRGRRAAQAGVCAACICCAGCLPPRHCGWLPISVHHHRRWVPTVPSCSCRHITWVSACCAHLCGGVCIFEVPCHQLQAGHAADSPLPHCCFGGPALQSPSSCRSPRTCLSCTCQTTSCCSAAMRSCCTSSPSGTWLAR